MGVNLSVLCGGRYFLLGGAWLGPAAAITPGTEAIELREESEDSAGSAGAEAGEDEDITLGPWCSSEGTGGDWDGGARGL